MTPDRDPGVRRAREIRRQLDRVRAIAIADALLLIPLVIAAIRHSERTVDVLGPIHGIGFLALMYLVLRGVGKDLWGWWFPALVVVTLGPPGSLIGDLRIRRSLGAHRDHLPRRNRSARDPGW